MKIDFDMLETLAAAGAPASAIIAYLRAEDAKRAPKRKADRERAQAKPSEKSRKRANPSETARTDATIEDSPRARLFREGGNILASLGRPDRAARALLAQWLKLTHDDCQLVMSALQRARDLGVADVAGWMLTTLNGKVKNGTGTRSLASAADDLITRAEDFDLARGPVVDHERH